MSIYRVNPFTGELHYYGDDTVDIKYSVRVASTANIVVADALINASVIDEVTVATGDRVLLKNQTASKENGIYVVVASGAAPRSLDANTSPEVTSGMSVFVSEGRVSGRYTYSLITKDPITLGTTPLAFTMSGGGAGAALMPPIVKNLSAYQYGGL